MSLNCSQLVVCRSSPRWYVSMVKWNWQGKAEDLGEKPHYPPQIPHGLTRARNRASAVRRQRLTAWAIAQNCKVSLQVNILRSCLKILWKQNVKGCIELEDYSLLGYRSPWWWKQYAHTKRRSNWTRLHGAVIFILDAVRTLNLAVSDMIIMLISTLILLQMVELAFYRGIPLVLRFLWV
jgi:hypothetical protein